MHSAQRREEMLGLLRESLAEWESRVDWDTLPESRRIALNTLAEESASTLRELIRNFEARSGAANKPGPQESVDGGA